MATVVNNHHPVGLASSTPRFLAKLSPAASSTSIEHKMAELRSAYASTPTKAMSASLSPNTPIWRSGYNRSSLPSPTPTAAGEMAKNGLHPGGVPQRRASSAFAGYTYSPSIMDLAESAGLLSLSPSDLVFESSMLGIAYYDFVLSVSVVPSPQSNATKSRDASQQSRGNTATAATSPTKRRVHGTGSEPNGCGTTAAPMSQCASPRKKRDQTDKGASGGLAELLRKQQLEQKNSSNQSQAEEVRKESAGGGSESETTSTTSSSSTNPTLYRLFLAKFDAHTNVEWFESVVVPAELLERNGIPVSELSLLTMGILVWRGTLNNARLLCLANGQLNAGDDNTAALEALKRAACKYKCMHHVLTIGQRRQSASSTHSSCSTNSCRSSSTSSISGSHSPTSQDTGMKLRILMCQSRNELKEVPSQAVRDTKFLLAPSSNPLLCLCFPRT